jgi:hypothetical protein
MSTRYELEQLKRRVERLDHEVGDTRRQIEALEARLAAEGALASPPDFTPPVSVPEPPPVIVSAPPEATPPPLPPFSPAPRPVAHPAPTFTAVPAAPSPLRGWLEQLQLWPPSGEDNTEVRLGAWWATRVGALLAVIGVVFFGVYVSLNTPAWVKFIELAAIALGVSAFGLWLTRKFETFGGVVFAGGLALGYFTTYAGYAVPAVKVIDNLWVAAGWQFATVAALVAAALWRRSQPIATLAVGLGFATAIFSRNAGLTGFALLTAGLLGAVSVGLRRRKGWEAPSVVAMPFAYGLLALVWHGAWQREAVPAAGWAWGCIGALAVMFFLRDWRRVKVTSAEVTNGERWFQGVNSTLAVLSGVVLTLWLYRSDLAEFYFGTAAVLGTMAWLRSRQVERDAVCAVLLAKTSGALTLGVIEIADARTTAIALLVQAWVMAWTARRLGSRVLAAGTLLVATVATWFHFTQGIPATDIFSIGAAQATLFALGLAALATEGGRWLIAGEDERRTLDWFAAFASGAAGIVAVLRWTPPGWSPALLTGLATLFALTAWTRRGAAAAWASALSLIAANAVLWIYAIGGMHDENLPLNAALVLITSAGVAWVLGGRERWKKWSLTAGALTVIGAVLTGFNLSTGAVALGLSAGGALVLSAFAPKAPGRSWNALATLATGFGVFCWVNRVAPASPLLWMGCTALALWSLPVIRRRTTDAVTLASAPHRLMDAWQVIFATIVTVRVLTAHFHGAFLIATLTAAGAAIFALGLRPGIRAAIPASWVALVAALLVAASMRPYSTNHFIWLWLGVALALTWVPAVLWTRSETSRQGTNGWWLRHAAGVQCTLATLLGAVAARKAFSALPELLACIVITLMAVAVHRFGKVHAARRSAVALAVLLGLSTLNFINYGASLGWLRQLGGVALASLVLGLLPLWIAGGLQPWTASTRKHALWIGGGGALALWFLACIAQKGALAPYVTLGWGLAAGGCFLGGLLLRTAPYRLLGLIGLALCIPRVFFVDLQSPLHRIIAFMALGVLLLWVGFSYHRFRHLIADASPGTDEKPHS